MGIYSRKDWILRSSFHPLSNLEVLEKVENSLAQQLNSKEAQKPVVLFDLDSTLYEVGHRTLAILREWNQAPKVKLKIQALLDQIDLKHIGYSLSDIAQNLGLHLAHPETETALKELKPFWWERFFSNDYLPHDKPYPGAVEYAQRLFQQGAHIIYLTGREEGKMLKVTIENLKRDQFPWCDKNTHLVMKPSGVVLDVAHKQNVKPLVEKTGKLIASFENEPVNLVALSKTFPSAMHIFMDTVYSDHPTEPGKNLFRIQTFKKD